MPVRLVGFKSTALAAVPLHISACTRVSVALLPSPTWWEPSVPRAVEKAMEARLVGLRSTALAAGFFQRKACVWELPFVP